MSTNPTQVLQYVCYQLSAPDSKRVLTLWQKKKKTPMVNYNAYYPERSGKALPTNNLALIVQRIDFYFS